MRAHGRYFVDQNHPRALATCDRCGFIYNHDQLRWEMQWVGPKLQNQRFLVCDRCWDVPQEQLRTIVLPPDPIPIQNARPENYIGDNNPISGIGASPNFALDQQTNSAFIGNITGGAGIAAAFDGNVYKVAHLSAKSPTISNSSFDNYIGVNWRGYVAATQPANLPAPSIKHTITSFAIYAPQDRSFLPAATDYVIQASQSGAAVFGAWTTLASGTTAGTAGEVIEAQCGQSQTSQFHRVAFQGDGTNYVTVAQVQFNVGQTGEAEIV